MNHYLSPLITSDENQKLIYYMGRGREIIYSTVAQIYFVDNSPNSWKYDGTGVVCLVKNHTAKTFVLIFFDFKKKTITFKQDIYNRMPYIGQTSYLHSFESDKTIVGLNFAYERDAAFFAENVRNKIETIKIKHESNSNLATGGRSSQIKSKNTEKESKKTSESKPKLKKSSTKPKQKEKINIENCTVSKPRDFRVVMHYGTSGIVFDEEAKVKLEKLGYTEDQLNNPALTDALISSISDCKGKTPNNSKKIKRSHTGNLSNQNSSENILQSSSSVNEGNLIDFSESFNSGPISNVPTKTVENYNIYEIFNQEVTKNEKTKYPPPNCFSPTITLSDGIVRKNPNYKEINQKWDNRSSMAKQQQMTNANEKSFLDSKQFFDPSPFQKIDMEGSKIPKPPERQKSIKSSYYQSSKAEPSAGNRPSITPNNLFGQIRNNDLKLRKTDDVQQPPKETKRMEVKPAVPAQQFRNHQPPKPLDMPVDNKPSFLPNNLLSQIKGNDLKLRKTEESPYKVDSQKSNVLKETKTTKTKTANPLPSNKFQPPKPLDIPVGNKPSILPNNLLSQIKTNDLKLRKTEESPPKNTPGLRTRDAVEKANKPSNNEMGSKPSNISNDLLSQIRNKNVKLRTVEKSKQRNIHHISKENADNSQNGIINSVMSILKDRREVLFSSESSSDDSEW